MTWTAPGSFASAVNSSSLALTNQGIGNLVLVETVNWSNTTAWISNVTGGGCTWTQVVAHAVMSVHAYTVSLWAGTVTTTGAQTATLVWNTAAPSGYQTQAKEFHSSVGSWVLDKSATLDNAGTATWPSLTPTGTGELYWGYSNDEGSSAGLTAGSTTAGYVGNVDAAGCLAAYNLNISAASGPVAADAGNSAGIMILMAEGAAAPAAGPPSLPEPDLPPGVTPMSFRRMSVYAVQVPASVPGLTLANAGLATAAATAPAPSVVVPTNAPAGAAVAVAVAYNPSMARPVISGLSGSTGADYFIDQYGHPRLMFCDAVWPVIYSAGRSNGNNWQADMNQVLSTRGGTGAGGGYTALECNLLPNGEYATYTGKNIGGYYPFGTGTGGTDPTTGLNANYWNQVDYWVNTAATYGITCFLNLCMGEDISTGPVGAWSAAQKTAYGNAVATRYLGKNNIIWMMGDDGGTDATTASNIMSGIRAAGDTRPVSFENPQETTSRYSLQTSTAQPWNSSGYIGYQWGYNYAPTYQVVEYAFNEPSPLPVLRGDGYYFGTIGGTDDKVAREQFWWAMSSGSIGYSWGVSDGGYNAGFAAGWASGMTLGGEEAGTAGDFQNQVMPKVTAWLMNLPGWQKLRADYPSAFITSARGTRAPYQVVGVQNQYTGTPPDTYVSASIAADGSIAMIYFSRGAVVTITVNQSLMAAGYTATWVDPATTTTSAGTAGATYTKPAGANSAGDHDWLLLLQAPPATSAPAGLATAAATAPAPSVTTVTGTNAPAGLATAAAAATDVTGLQGTAIGVSAGLAAAAGAVPVPVRNTVAVNAGLATSAATAPAPSVTTSATTTAPAGLAAAAAAAPVPSAQVAVTAGADLVAAAAPAPAAAAGSQAGLAAATAAAPAPSVTTAATANAPAGLAAVTAAAPVPGTAVSGTAGLAAASAAAPAVTVSTSSNITAAPPVTTATAAAPAPSLTLAAQPPAGLAAAAASVPVPGTAVSGLAGLAASAASAPAPSAQVAVSGLAGLAAAAATAPAPSPTGTVSPAAGLATAAAAALAPVITTSSNVTVAPPVTTATAAAPVPSLTLAAQAAAGLATAAATAPGTGTAATANAGLAQAAASALAPSAQVAVSATAGLATVSASALAPSVQVAVSAAAGLAAAAASAPAPSVTTAATGTASPGVATAAGAAPAPGTAIAVAAGLAAASAAAPAPSVQRAAVAPAGLAAAAAGAPAPSVRAAVTAGPFPPATATVLPGGTGTWVNPGNVFADDGSVAYWTVP